MNNINDLLPIGSVVLLKEGSKRIMIFGIKQTDNENAKEYDYIGVLYPEGNVGELGYFLFNHEDISVTYFRGYEDEERRSFIKALDDYYSLNK